MCKRFFAFLPGLLVLFLSLFPQEDFKVENWVVPATVAQGQSGVLKIKITMRPGVRVSSHPEFMIRFSESEQFSFSKIFFTGSELNLPRVQEGDAVFLDLQKEIEIPFRVNEGAFIGRHTIKGEIIFTILSPDNWYIKTVQKFSAPFLTRKGTGKKGSSTRKMEGRALAGFFTEPPRLGTSGRFRPPLLPGHVAA